MKSSSPVKCGVVPTVAHLARWAERNKPGWARELSLPVASIDSIINQRAGIKWPVSLDAALFLLETVRQNIASSAGKRTLESYWASYDDGVSAYRSRTRHYRRWLRGLRKAKARL